MSEQKLCPCCGAPLVEDGTVRVDAEGRFVVGHGHVLKLARQKFALFLELWTAAPRAVSREKLLEATAIDIGFDDREIKVVDVHVSRLRKALKPFGIEIETIWGHGYRIIRGANANTVEVAAASTGREAAA